jgi:hypothetical protein
MTSFLKLSIAGGTQCQKLHQVYHRSPTAKAKATKTHTMAKPSQLKVAVSEEIEGRGMQASDVGCCI